MSKIIFKAIGCKNFHSFEELSFPIVQGKHLVSGVNGSGKSTIFEILPWVIYKFTTRGKNPSRNYNGDCVAWVEFCRDNNTYKIERYLNHKTEGNNVKLYCNNEEITKRINTETEKEILNTIGITEELFISTIVVLQGLPHNFSTLTPTIRKSIIEEMLKFSIWDSLKKKIFSLIKETSLKKNELELQFNSKKETMIKLNSKLEMLKQIQEKSINDTKEKIKNIKNTFRLCQKELVYLEAQKVELLNTVKLNSNIELESRINEINNNIIILKNKLSSITSLLKTKICPECGQTYPENKILGAEEELDILTKNLNKLETELSLLKDVNNKLKPILNDINTVSNNINFYLKELESITLRPNNLSDEDILLIESELNTVVEEVNILKGSLDEVNNKFNLLKYLEGLMQPSSKFRTFVLKKYLSNINEILKSITPLIFNDLTISLDVDAKETGIDINILKNGNKFEYKSLSGGQKRRLDIAIILSLQKFLIESSGISTNLLVFDEVFDSLDESSINIVLSAINMIFSDTSSIYVITHNNSVKEQFDSIINVKLDNGISVLN